MHSYSTQIHIAIMRVNLLLSSSTTILVSLLSSCFAYTFIRSPVVARKIPKIETIAVLPKTTTLHMTTLKDFVYKRDESGLRPEDVVYLNELHERVGRIQQLGYVIPLLQDDELVAKTVEFKEHIKSGEDLNGTLLEEAFAVVQEATW